VKALTASVLVCGAIGLQPLVVPSFVHAAASARADVSTEALDYTLSVLCTEFVAELHEPKANEPARQFVARRYYGVLFTIWFGSQSDPHLRTFDMRGYIRAFQRASAKDGFSSLIDYNDPLGWTRVPAGVDSSQLIEAIGDPGFYQRVLEQTRNQAVYKDAVRRFRELCESTKAAP
jgi:hypothetical protein